MCIRDSFSSFFFPAIAPPSHGGKGACEQGLSGKRALLSLQETPFQRSCRATSPAPGEAA
eukprot:4036086-Alexandrium_andersonii.AAC.1